jgi:hypothetical protein
MDLPRKELPLKNLVERLDSCARVAARSRPLIRVSCYGCGHQP